MLKTCFKCHRELEHDQFYVHRYMADGRLGKCKECTKRDVTEHRRDNHAAVCAYDRARAKTPERKANVREYAKNSRARSPEKYRARYMVSIAIRDGKLKRLPCRVCSSPDAEAHHTDYSMPLDVDWLCFNCHRTVGHSQHVEAVDHSKCKGKGS